MAGRSGAHPAWDCLPGDSGVPYLTERENFRQVLLTDRLREAIARINLGEDGEPGLDEARVNQAVSRLERVIPDYAERQRWLKEHGGRYDL